MSKKKKIPIGAILNGVGGIKGIINTAKDIGGFIKNPKKNPRGFSRAVSGVAIVGYCIDEMNKTGPTTELIMLCAIGACILIFSK